MVMERERFVDLMLTDQKSFAGYARLFMDLKSSQVQGFLDWCWEKYMEGDQPSPNSTGYGDGNFRFSEERTPLPEDLKMDIAIRSTTEARESWERWPSGVLTGSAEGTAADPVFLEGVLPQEEFLERLRFEKRRVDRSGNPLSMALFFLKEELLADARKLREFLVSIKRDTRETDLKGWVNGSIFGLLMLDTDDSGAHKCVELLVNGRTKTVCDVLTGTYPDRLFDEILEKTGAEPRIFSLESLETVDDAPGQQILKRWLDILGALIGLVCFSPRLC